MGFSLIKYFVFTGIPFFIFYKFFYSCFLRNKIQERLAKKKDFLREIGNSMVSSVVMVLVSVVILKTSLVEYSSIYTDIHSHSLWFIPLGVVFSYLLHDTYFYWTHRLLHTKLLYKRFHLVHHKSINPSPFSSFSFHFMEALIAAIVTIPIVFIIPIHPIAILIYSLLSFAMNVYGHLGYEIMPKWFRRTVLFKIFNTSVHHNMHHSKFVGNFGLYTRFWDRLLGTEYSDYEASYDKIQHQRFGDPSEKV